MVGPKALYRGIVLHNFRRIWVKSFAFSVFLAVRDNIVDHKKHSILVASIPVRPPTSPDFTDRIQT